MIWGWALWSAAAFAIEPGTWFEYTLTRDVVGTHGEYRGYTERLKATGRYELPADGQVHATYRWDWRASDGKSEAGSEDRSVTWDPASRRYSGERTDLDEYDGKPVADLGVWFWIPPDTPAGSSLRILDHDFRVVGRDVRFQGSGVDRAAIELVADGRAERHDAYGNFSYTWTERFLFDAETGLVLSDRYEEHDTALDGSGSAFDWTETLVVGRASIDPSMVPAPAPAEPELDEGVDRTWVYPLLGMLLVPFVGLGLWWSQRPVPTEPVGDPEALTGQGAELTPLFAPFLPDIARKAALLGAPALVARRSERLTGFGCRDPESMVGTVFAADARTAKSLAAALGASEFFVERQEFAGGKPVEPFAVLARGTEPRPTWDPGLIRRGRPGDVAGITALNQEIYGVPCARWAQAQLDAGDFLYVADVDGRLVGFGFASLAGTHGRLHGLVVHPEFRNRGLGSELARARVRVLLDLGAERILTEIAEGNVASLHIAGQLGFTRAGRMFAVPRGAKALWFRR